MLLIRSEAVAQQLKILLFITFFIVPNFQMLQMSFSMNLGVLTSQLVIKKCDKSWKPKDLKDHFVR